MEVLNVRVKAVKIGFGKEGKEEVEDNPWANGRMLMPL